MIFLCCRVGREEYLGYFYYLYKVEYFVMLLIRVRVFVGLSVLLIEHYSMYVSLLKNKKNKKKSLVLKISDLNKLLV